jgi:hypothetical protein
MDSCNNEPQRIDPARSQQILNAMEEIEMTAIRKINGAKNRIARVLRSHYTVKLAAGLALGALLLSTTGFPFGNSDANTQQKTASGTEGVANPVTPERMITSVEDSEMYDLFPEGTHWGTAYPVCWGMNHPTCPTYGQQRAADRHLENLDILVEELEAQVIGVPALVSSEVREQDRCFADLDIDCWEVLLPASGASFLRSTAAFSSDDIAENFSRIREEGRVADRQDELKDMIQYWNQLKQSALASDQIITNQEYDDNPVLDHDQWKIEQPVDLVELFGQEVVTALGYEVLSVKLNQYLADGPLTSRRMERLDNEIDMLLLTEAREAYNAEAISDQEVERLKHKINELLQAAANDPYASLRLIDREIERLDYRIDMTMINAARHPSASSD